MNQYQLENALYKIEGHYHNPTSEKKDPEAVFELAKKALLRQMQEEISRISHVSFNQFKSYWEKEHPNIPLN